MSKELKLEEKELLLKDLCARLRSGIIVKAQYKDGEGWKTEDRKLLGIYEDGQVYIDCAYTNVENVKPYLRPMSSMTVEEEYEYHQCNNIDYLAICEMEHTEMLKVTALCFSRATDWLNKKGFDYRGLIDKGLALEAPKYMYSL